MEMDRRSAVFVRRRSQLYCCPVQSVLSSVAAVYSLIWCVCVYVQWACGSAPHSLTKHRLVDTLVENGADLEAVDRQGRSCLHYAAASGDFLLVQALVQEFNMAVTRLDLKQMTPEQVAGTDKCAAYLSQCRKVPPPKNQNFVPQRFLKTRTESVVVRHAEPRAIGTYLMKKSPSLMKGWQKRYFVMKEGHLRYYGTVRLRRKERLIVVSL